MKSQKIILIADRNPHVRSFLARELKAEGFRIRLAGNGGEVLKWVYHSEPLDLIILDPDLPDDNGREILPKLYDRIPVIPVVIHSWSSDYIKPMDEPNGVAFVKKEGNSIEALKKVVQKMLNDKTY
ncbi:MAG: response regulator [Deltaproteobacteria bacterium]|nr:response regulator [Deltaproteobacteria bacterium]